MTCANCILQHPSAFLVGRFGALQHSEKDLDVQLFSRAPGPENNANKSLCTRSIH